MDKTDRFGFLKRNLEFEIWSDKCGKMLKNGVNQDFLENSSKDYANIGNLNETNDTLSNGIFPMFWKNLDHEIWSNSG